jgi:CBS domain-containing protein
MNVAQAMTRDVATASPSDTLERAAQRMRQRDCGSLPVVDARGRVLGVITDRDVLMAALERRRALHEVRVWEVMSCDVVACSPLESLISAAETMRERQVRRLPVLDLSHGLAGVLSLADVARVTTAGGVAGEGDLGLDDLAFTLAGITAPRAVPARACAVPAKRARTRDSEPATERPESACA